MKAMDLGDLDRCNTWNAAEVAGRNVRISWEVLRIGHAIGQSEPMAEQGLALAAISAAS